MTNHDDRHTSLRSTGDELKVSIGNGAKCPLKGMGIISFKMKEGSTRELTDVLWVLDLTENPLSVGPSLIEIYRCTLTRRRLSLRIARTRS